MEQNRNYITVDNPNISPSLKPDIPYGTMMNVLSDTAIDDLYANVKLHDMFFPHVSVRTMEGEFNYDAVFSNECNQGADMIASCLILEGNITSALRGSDKGVLFTSGTQALKYDPFNEYGHWCPANSPFNIVHLSIEPDYLFSLLPEDEGWSAYIREQIMLRKRIFGNVPPLLSIAQHHALHNLLNCPLDGKLGLLMMEASLTQILLLQLSAQFKDVSKLQGSSLANRDMEIIQSLKEFLVANFLEEHTMMNLARQFGTNTNKLMTLFKKVFHMSIFEYLHDLKMDHAKRLLMDEGKFVSEVASCVGYKNPHHFSAAFKKKHGINPSRLKSYN